MDILKASTDWAKAELFSTPFFILFGVLFVLAGIGFWQLGKTEMARAFIFPTYIAGTLLMIIGVGLYSTNANRLKQFERDYNSDSRIFVESELALAKSALKEYKTVVFTAFPIVIALCALVILFVNTPIWRASMITTIAMLVVILFIDATANARIEAYQKQLQQASSNINKVD